MRSGRGRTPMKRKKRRRRKWRSWTTMSRVLSVTPMTTMSRETSKSPTESSFCSRTTPYSVHRQ